MGRRLLAVSAIAVGLFLGARLGAVDLTYNFEGCPQGVIEGTPGEVKSFEFYATLTTENNEFAPDHGVQGWTLSCAASGATFTSCTYSGVVVSTNWGDFDLRQLPDWCAAGGSSRIDCSNPSWCGSTRVLAMKCDLFLLPSGTQRVARLAVDAAVPEAGAESEVVIEFTESSTCKPGNYFSLATIYGSTFYPALGSCTFTLRGKTGGLQRPGDVNQDAQLDMSDAIWLLGHLFLGGGKKLPCEGGTAGAPGPGDLSVSDVNGDGVIDVSDPVSILSFLFQGTKPPDLGKDCVAVAGCPAVCQ